MPGNIVIKGARANNLKNIDVTIPVITPKDNDTIEI